MVFEIVGLWVGGRGVDDVDTGELFDNQLHGILVMHLGKSVVCSANGNCCDEKRVEAIILRLPFIDSHDDVYR